MRNGWKNDKGQISRVANVYACRFEIKEGTDIDSKIKEAFENMKLHGYFCYNFETEKIKYNKKLFCDIICDAIFLGKKKVKTFVPKKEWSWQYPV